MHIHKLLRHNCMVVQNTKIRHKDAMDERIFFSIAILSETIQQVMFDLLRDPEKLPLGAGTWRNPQNALIGKFICDEMLKKGWCKFDVHKINLTSKAASTLYFLANKWPTRPGLDHSKCTENLCTWMSINEDYKTRHAAPNCHCESFLRRGRCPADPRRRRGDPFNPRAHIRK